MRDRKGIVVRVMEWDSDAEGRKVEKRKVSISKTFRNRFVFRNDAWVNMSRNQTFNSTLILFSAALSMADMVAPWKSLLRVWNAGFEVRCFYRGPRVVIAW